MRLALSLAFASLCAVSGVSHADALDLPDSSSPQTTPGKGDSMSLGLGLAYVPEYAGSDKGRVVPLPIFERTFDNGAFLSTTRGVGVQTTAEGFGLSAALSYGGGRPDHKKNLFYGSDALKGMGDIDGAVQAVLGASYQLGTVGLSLGTTQNLAHREHGATYTLGASIPLYSTASHQVSLGLSAVYGDDKHMQTYYGVTAAQASRTAFKAYGAKAGFENVAAAVSWTHVIDKNWSAHSVLGVTHLSGDAADSPLTRRATTPMLISAISYKF